MKRNFLTWWAQRTVREQRLLLVMFGCAAIFFLWFGVIRPLGHALEEERGRHDRAVLALVDARAQIDAIRRIERERPSDPDMPMGVFVRQSAREAGFGGARIDEQGRGVSVVIDAARPQALFSWVGDLEGRDGFVIDQLSARANSDATLAVQFLIRERAR